MEAVARPTHSVTFYPARHPAKPFSNHARLRVKRNQSPAESLLHSVISTRPRVVKEVLHTSFPASADLLQDIIPQKNGLVHTVIEAYNNHRGLILRPDDVWLAIMTQFSFFVHGRSEALRKTFVAHDGKRELTVMLGGDRYTMDPAFMVDRMMSLMETHITDPSLRAWIVPDFTTTTALDRTTSALVMMGMMKDYFVYKGCFLCGIPKVTLEGTLEDWQALVDRIAQLDRYGDETVGWYHLLRPILTRFVAGYAQPNHPDNLDFWNRIVSYESGGSGPPLLSGWITAFCVFDVRGRWRGGVPKRVERPRPSSLYDTPHLELDGFRYPVVDSEHVPCGYVAVDVLLNDNGQTVETMFIAGSVGSQMCRTESDVIEDGPRDTVRPVTAWWYFTKCNAEEAEEEAEDAEEETEEVIPEVMPNVQRQPARTRVWHKIGAMFQRRRDK